MTQEQEMGVVSFRNEWQRASLGILCTYGMLLGIHQRFFGRYGLTSQQYNALRILRDQQGTPVSTSFLCERMLDRMPDVPRLVARLRQKGLVETTVNARDRRLVSITLSARGEGLLGTIGGEIHRLDDLLRGLAEGEAGELAQLLGKARESIRAAEGDVPQAGGAHTELSPP